MNAAFCVFHTSMLYAIYKSLKKLFYGSIITIFTQSFSPNLGIYNLDYHSVVLVFTIIHSR